MSVERVQPENAEGPHLLLYDGVCGLCNRLVQFVLRWDHRRLFEFAALQSGFGREVLERFGHDPSDLKTLFVVADHRGGEARVFTKARAVLFVMEGLGFPLRAFCVLGALPTRLLDFAYDLVARSRYRVFGRRDACLVPPPEVRARFLDSPGAEERRSP